jgi:hypothetical protein
MKFYLIFFSFLSVFNSSFCSQLAYEQEILYTDASDDDYDCNCDGDYELLNIDDCAPNLENLTEEAKFTLFLTWLEINKESYLNLTCHKIPCNSTEKLCDDWINFIKSSPSYLGTGLLISCKKTLFFVTDLLLSLGANPKVKNELGQNVLHIAAIAGNDAFIIKLIALLNKYTPNLSRELAHEKDKHGKVPQNSCTSEFLAITFMMFCPNI